MRRGPILVLLVIAMSLAGVSGAAAVSTCLRSGCGDLPQLVTAFEGHTSPRALPKHSYAPVVAQVSGKIETTDGTHPSALREAVVDIDKEVKINVRGYPVCHTGARDIRAQRKVCTDSVLGQGRAHFEIEFPEREPMHVPVPLKIYNGGESGHTVKLLIAMSVPVPAPSTFAAEITIERKGSGLHAVAKAPATAGGAGSLIDFSFKLGKTYSYEGEKVGYFEAKCPDEIFEVNAPSVVFKNESHTPAVAATTVLKGGQTIPCTPKG